MVHVRDTGSVKFLPSNGIVAISYSLFALLVSGPYTVLLADHRGGRDERISNLLEMIEMIRRINLLVVPGLVLASLLLFASPVYAQATTSTMTFHSATVTFPGVSVSVQGSLGRLP